jgi:hypothetical protein
MDWVEVSVELPDELQTVLVSTAAGNVTVGAVYEGAWEVEFAPWESPPSGGEEVMTHWMPLPLPPLCFGDEGRLRGCSRGGAEL